MRIASLIVAVMSVGVLAPQSRADFVYTTSINYNGLSGVGSQTFMDNANQVAYTQTAVTTATAITGTSPIKLADQLLTLSAGRPASTRRVPAPRPR